MNDTIIDALQKVLDTLKSDPNAIMTLTAQNESPESATLRLISNIVTLKRD